MSHSNLDLSAFVFRSILKSMWWSAMGMLIACWVIVFAFILTAILIGIQDFASIGLTGVQEIVSHDLGFLEDFSIIRGGASLLGGLLYLIYLILVFGIIGFVLLGIPAGFIPFLLGSTILSAWLYHDEQTNKLSSKKAQLKGTIIGGAGGLAALFTPVTYFSWPEIWIHFAQESQYRFLFWVILIVIPFAGAITGKLFARSLARELEPKEDYFSIDWEALQKEEQENN